MNQENFNILRQNCLEALGHFRLKDALSCLKALCMELNDSTLSIEQESIDSTYQMMLRFMSEGGVDPQRASILDGLLVRSYILLTRATRCFKLKHGSGIYADTLRRTEAKRAIRNQDKLIEQIQMQVEVLAQTTDSDKKEDIANLTNNLNELFYEIWTAPLYEEVEAQKLINFMAELNEIQIRFLLSALLLNLFEGFDFHKFRIILSYLTNPNDEIRSHALTIFYFVCQKHEKEICCNKNLIKEIALIKNSKQLETELIQLQKQLIICQKTEKAEKQLQEKIMPDLLKGNWAQIQKMGIDNHTDIHNLLTNLDGKQEKKLQDNMQTIMKMNEEGLDINTGVFKSMCNLPFFHTFTNWFWPFYPEHPSINNLSSNDESGANKKLPELLNRLPQLSDLDKYGMACLVRTFPQMQSNTLMNEFSSMLDEQNLPQYAAKKSIKSIQKNETQSLYRFFYFNAFKSQFYNPFLHNCLFTDNVVLRPIVFTPSFIEELTDFLVENGYYETVIEYTEEAIKYQEVTSRHLKNLGFAYQKTGHFNKALQYYQQADLLTPNDAWILNQQQHCYEQTGRIDLRLQCLVQLEEIEPEKIEITMEIILCLVQLKRFEEALKRSFKLEYLGQKELFAQRIIGWSYLQTNQAENALKYYQKILNSTKAKWEDYINAGHAAWVLGLLPQAISCYQEFIKRYLSNATDWESKFQEDLPLLYSYGITETDIFLMQDMLRL